jgi:hypothetical protein
MVLKGVDEFETILADSLSRDVQVFQGGDIAYRQAGATATLTPQSVVFMGIQWKTEID